MYAKYIMEHLSEMLLGLSNPLKKLPILVLYLTKKPTYAEIDYRTQLKSSPPEVSELLPQQRLKKRPGGGAGSSRLLRSYSLSSLTVMCLISGAVVAESATSVLELRLSTISSVWSGPDGSATPVRLCWPRMAAAVAVRLRL